MYDVRTRRALAIELTTVFLEGRWRAEELAERGAGALDPRPGWIEELAGDAEALGCPARDFRGRRRFIHRIERFLADRDGTGAPPQILRHLVAGSHRDRTPHPFAHDWPVVQIHAFDELAERVELDLGHLLWLADVRSLERTVADERLRNYRYRWVERRHGLPRLIEAPKLKLKEVQRWVLREILDHVPAHDAAHGFTRGRSVLTHATVHTGQPAVLRLDLRDFFASIAARRVYGLFRMVGYDEPVAHLLTGLCTNVAAQMAWAARRRVTDPDLVPAQFWLGRQLATPHLPQGAPTSPALANLAAFGLDRRLTGVAQAFGLRYSRYADDLTFSGPGLTGARSRAIAELAARIAASEGFQINPAKSNLRTAARRQMVTGVVVNAHPNVARDEYDRLRATLHRAALHGPGAVQLSGAGATTGGEGVDLEAHLRGRVSWVTSLNPRRGEKLARLFDAVDWGD